MLTRLLWGRSVCQYSYVVAVPEIHFSVDDLRFHVATFHNEKPTGVNAGILHPNE